ncbi:hypothetical protein PHYSODRAFT_285009 [Phytophthora sojae]|uniref:Uncharacterized protein n=1 Tax=Phytophthora sojae (strain P6497) TaxID=1094619 RepID=G4YW72_PHYSP|nr:hypothetical protein PHYSODRAFT_285009 [Phytophthora sojae]EGZ24962.1 hypothetical protein PHYSODRAFT_285009 [Phytophthora sojae]|eukprot:XP_009520250.1 hypothetical protein PHYSODRAFT_285009 [Phytophthora sojae]
MPSPVASSSSVSAPQSLLSVQRPALSPRKRKLSDASVAEAASPTSLDEVAGSPLEERVISPKKKARAEERASSSSDLSKWESHVVASIASALDLDCIDDKQSSRSSSSNIKPIAFSAAPAGDLAADELQILRHFLA